MRDGPQPVVKKGYSCAVRTVLAFLYRHIEAHTHDLFLLMMHQV